MMFFSKLQHTDNHILRTLIHLPMLKYEMLGLAAKYGLSGTQGVVSNIRDAVWSCFAQNLDMLHVLVFLIVLLFFFRFLFLCGIVF